jgi:Na+/H+ antiporter NhaA
MNVRDQSISWHFQLSFFGLPLLAVLLPGLILRPILDNQISAIVIAAVSVGLMLTMIAGLWLVPYKAPKDLHLWHYGTIYDPETRWRKIAKVALTIGLLVFATMPIELGYTEWKEAQTGVPIEDGFNIWLTVRMVLIGFCFDVGYRRRQAIENAEGSGFADPNANNWKR